MHNLKPITPLGADTPRTDTIGPVTLSEQTGWALASVAARLGRETDCRTGLKKLLGKDAPAPSGVVTGKQINAFWTGPDQWMLEAPFETHEDIARIVKADLGDSASVTEQTDGWARFDLDGSDLASVFERLCNLDIATMTDNAVQRTAIEHMGCFVICRVAGQSYSVICPRSSAGSLHHAITAALKSVF